MCFATNCSTLRNILTTFFPRSSAGSKGTVGLLDYGLPACAHYAFWNDVAHLLMAVSLMLTYLPADARIARSHSATVQFQRQNPCPALLLAHGLVAARATELTYRSL